MTELCENADVLLAGKTLKVDALAVVERIEDLVDVVDAADELEEVKEADCVVSVIDDVLVSLVDDDEVEKESVEDDSLFVTVESAEDDSLDDVPESRFGVEEETAAVEVNIVTVAAELELEIEIKVIVVVAVR